MAEVTPLCSVFGECGGCAYQDIPYAEELRIKEDRLQELFLQELKIGKEFFDPILASPDPYHYRHRIDLSLIKTKNRGTFIGFRDRDGKRVVEVENCAIARKEISGRIPQIKREAVEKLPQKYRTATITVKTGEDGRVFWGGIGRRSLRQSEEDYLWIDLNGKRIYYSLETFFQGNLSILSGVVEKIRALPVWSKQAVFFDLYGGVGLFALSVADLVKKAVLIEDSTHSAKIAKYNFQKNRLSGFDVYSGRVEEELIELSMHAEPKIAMIDPPRAGLSESALEAVSASNEIKDLLYLSCHPETLVRDLKVFFQKGWELQRVFPFDFFPKTTHVETLVWLKPKQA